MSWDYNRDKTTDLMSLIKLSSESYGSEKYIVPVEDEIDAITFEKLYEFAIKLDCFLKTCDAGQNDRIAVVFQNSTLMALLFLSVIATKRVLVPINPKSGTKEIDYILKDSSPKLLLYDSSIGEKINQLTFKNKKIVVGDHSELIEEIFNRDIDTAEGPLLNETESDGNIEAEIVFTSGTTGNPKGVVLTHRNLLEDSFAIGREFEFTSDTVFLTVCPLFHNSGQVPTTLVPLWCGGSTTAVRSDVGLLKFWYFVDHFEANWSFVTPAFLSFFNLRGESPQKKTMKGIFSGGAKLPNDMLKSFESRFSISVFEAYGLTETTSFATCVKKDLSKRVAGSVGEPLFINEIKIVSGQKELPPYEKGEIVIKGSNLFKEYLNLPELTSEKIKDGWFHSGDLGYKDENNNIFVVDRVDNMIIIGGENVYPSEVENLIPKLKGIKDGVLSSIPHDILGNELVLLYESKSDSAVEMSQWNGVFAQHLSSFKLPSKYINVKELGIDEIPRAENGKVLRKKIRELLKQKLL